MTHDQLVKTLEARLLSEKQAVARFMETRGEEITPEGDWFDVDPQGDRENTVWEAGMYTGMEMMLDLVKSLTK